MFVLDGTIEIGDFVFSNINDVTITKSVEELVDTAVIKLPTSFRVRQGNVQKFTEEAIKAGDPVKITLGYVDRYTGVEFIGFVKKVKPTIPLEIHCEDAMYELRRKNITKSWGKTTVKEILQEVVKGTSVKLSPDTVDMPVDKWIIRGANGTQVLESFKKDLLLTSFITDDGKLYCGLTELTNIAQVVEYDLNYNLVENNLEFKTQEDRKLKIKYTYIGPDNKRKSIEVGDPDGEQRTYHTSVISDESKLREMAQAEIKKLKYDGFEGDLKSFLIPYATRGMVAKIYDAEHKNREGSYYIKKVVITFGRNGARRTVTLGNKL